MPPTAARESVLIHRYCSTRDVSLLNRMSRAEAVTLLHVCLANQGNPSSNQNIIKEVIEHYGYNSLGDKIRTGDNARDRADRFFTRFPVAVTGAPPNSVLKACSPGINGAIIRIHGGRIPVETSRLDAIRSYPDLWNAFLLKLGGLQEYSGLSRIQRQIRLEFQEVQNEKSIGHDDGCRIEFLEPGHGDIFDKLTSEQIDVLMQGNQSSEDGYWSYSEIESMFPRKPGSGASRHTLVLIRSFWSICTDYSQVESYQGSIVNIDEGRVLETCDTGRIFVLPNFIQTYRSPTKRVKTATPGHNPKSGWIPENNDMNIAFVTDMHPIRGSYLSHYHIDVEFYDNVFRGFTPAAFKSLLQKIIRYRPGQIEVLQNGVMRPATEVLRATVLYLANSPGSFVPDIQRYVTGLESITKRLAIIVYEDSYLLEDIQSKLLSLVGAAIVAQRIKSWGPSEENIDSWLGIALEAYRSTFAAVCDFKGAVTLRPFVFSTDNSDLANISALLDALRSFPTDLGLARAWAIPVSSPGPISDVPGIQELVTQPDFPETMKIYRCVDQHWSPGFAHYFSTEYISTLPITATPSRPYEPLFSRVWNASSGFNPRRYNYILHEQTFAADILEIDQAQDLYMQARRKMNVERNRTGGEYKVEYDIDICWIAALVGPLEVKPKGKPVMLATLSTRDPYDISIIRRPSRSMITEPLTEEEVAEGMTATRTLLRKGVPMTSATCPIEELVGARLQLVGESYVIRVASGARVTWETISQGEIALRELEFDPSMLSMGYALSHYSSGVSIGAMEQLNHLLRNTDISFVRRSLIYLGQYSPKIEINRISQEGGSTAAIVSIQDTGAYQFLLKISVLFPAALRPDGPSRFQIMCSPLLWDIDSITRRFVCGHVDTGANPWHGVRFTDTSRELYDYQSEIVNELVENNESGQKGNMLWLKVGLGKTACVMTFLSELKQNNRLPPFVLYTLPESAISTVCKEVHRFGVKINWIIPVKMTAARKQQVSQIRGLGVRIDVSHSCVPVTGTINLVEHDHMRKCEDQFSTNAKDMFLVVDEVHKAMNDTKRTGVALELADLARDFLVLTGTPVIDQNTYKLIGWLSRVVDFDVNDKNLLVAANAMVSRKVSTGIPTTYEEIYAEMTTQQENDYRNYVPPALGGTNGSPTINDWTRASEVCYEASMIRMATLTNSLVDDGNGVMVVAKDVAQQTELRHLITNAGVDPRDIFVLGSGESIVLDDSSVERGDIHDYKVVIVRIRKAEGYTLTRLNCMVTSVYPSNNATREQMEGRIDRQGQSADHLRYYTVYTGLLRNLFENHISAKNLSVALASLAQEARE